MIALIQRVSEASVSVDGATIASIGSGMLALIGVERQDGPATAVRMAERLLTYRIFADADGKMNLNLTDTGGELLLVPNFTLAADTRKGTRASFTPAAAPALGEELFDALVAQLKHHSPPVQSGSFGADMQVSLINDGPVTFRLEVR